MTAKNPIAKSNIVLREEFDDWAILFDPDSGDAFGLNPTSVLIWKAMNGKNSVAEIVKQVEQKCTGIPQEASNHVQNFVKELSDKGFVGFELN